MELRGEAQHLSSINDQYVGNLHFFNCMLFWLIRANGGLQPLFGSIFHRLKVL